MNVECVLCAQIHPQGPHIYDFVDDVDDDLCCSICLSPFLRIRSNLNAMQSTLSSMIFRISSLWLIDYGESVVYGGLNIKIARF